MLTKCTTQDCALAHNDSESTCGSDTTIAFGGSEADGHPSKLIPSNQAKLTTLVREIHDLYQ